MIHMHYFDDEPPVQLDEDANPYPYMCRACEQETGDPYAWVAAALATFIKPAKDQWTPEEKGEYGDMYT